MEMIEKLARGTQPVKAALFDFDGTVSTIRCGWEKVMEPLMVEMICGQTPPDPAVIGEVREYIDRSTGIQTYYQMEWLAGSVARYGKNPGAPADPWWYKEEYNRRLKARIEGKIAALEMAQADPEEFLILGSREFLQALRKKGVRLFVASGTDDPDVRREARALGVLELFESVAGAPPKRADCSKEAVLRQLLDKEGFSGGELAVFGDGRVEIALGREKGARCVGIASDEEKRRGVNPVKRERLLKAGAQVICGDFSQKEELLDWLGL